MQANHNPYQTPQSNLSATNKDYDEIPPLYNPNAVALWALLFTPFGPWLHAKNWEDMGEETLAKQNRWCAIAITVFILISALLEMLTGIHIPNSISIGLLLGWYLSLGKKQITLVKEELGTDYEKKSLVKPVLLGVFGSIILVFILMFCMQAVLSMAGLLHPNWLK